MNIRSITLSNSEYPQGLRELENGPKVIFVSGKILKQDETAVAIVGSRQMTSYGKKLAWEFSFKLAQRGLTIVSGLARGIDTVAHMAAIEAKGRTIAVLGSSLDIVYPPENLNLANQITKNGAVISEFSKGTKPLGKNFLQRNRIIAAIVSAVLVIEGGKRSGTLSTATHAANLGKDVYAIPGSLDSPMSEAPLYLIEQGARIARKPEDILDSFE